MGQSFSRPPSPRLIQILRRRVRITADADPFSFQISIGKENIRELAMEILVLPFAFAAFMGLSAARIS